MSSNRRDFIRTASVLAAGSMIPGEALFNSRKLVASSDKIRVGLIGANGMGFNDLTSFLKNPELLEINSSNDTLDFIGKYFPFFNYIYFF